jgi:hypothetical protein
MRIEGSKALQDWFDKAVKVWLRTTGKPSTTDKRPDKRSQGTTDCDVLS